MVPEGAEEPEFALPGFDSDGIGTFDSAEAMDENKGILLVFYPFDFSPVCTTELCAIRDCEWFQFTPDLEVWAISADSVYAHKAFAEEYDLTFPLLSDSNGRAASAYGVCYDAWEDHESVPKRAVIFVDAEQTVQYAWHTDSAYEKPDFSPVKDAIDDSITERVDTAPADVEFSVEYDAEPTE